ncbi:hypothetical protein PROAA_480006 [Candidatus Propionivibrio aalborgensis]|uniref:Uncharacterized protein n=1 Tax=Candidatus Propionivibrio aalborgensis TaxID=1860101 RepID=A0A1A8Y0F9_9RHOO|nr:hypothetical protein PROAA_480006 [Candidatus Propionivibrio aalborgensis]
MKTVFRALTVNRLVPKSLCKCNRLAAIQSTLKHGSRWMTKHERDELGREWLFYMRNTCPPKSGLVRTEVPG